VATISSLLADHVSLRVRSVDRIFLAGRATLAPDRREDGLRRSRSDRCWRLLLGLVLGQLVDLLDPFAFL
jgi:hypothetical protein